eukprot:CAMPEP_0184362812 /NCGR_PEP_ID=MMETSP1089-20130417/136636_1 /TAXON_ID=38269 ORGANISM="Gloeochaete wittrockiana, Strain SAG46.84" /NCGR_SAMPLE_ID=MMETSP1089 /ASSEMBLY_ACC=CAM_ASM_000445 /LENGTH=307 /DNA_ID=CAMNT_0026703053 /DNA_START=35 /DNA_END=955 /DNA_ORIENTATION=+
MAKLAQRIHEDLPSDSGIKSLRIEWEEELKKMERSEDGGGEVQQYDLVIAAYLLGELTHQKSRKAAIRSLWRRTRDVLVIIEPGRSDGYHRILETRGVLAAAGDGYIVAPCAGEGPCPLSITGSFCHFFQRVNRTPLQKWVKSLDGAFLPYEDEKFSYVVFRRGVRPPKPMGAPGWKEELSDEDMAALLKTANGDEGIDSKNSNDDPKNSNEGAASRNSMEGVSKNNTTEAGDRTIIRTPEDDSDVDVVAESYHWSRILQMPRKRGGHVYVEVCTPEMTRESRIITRARYSNEIYRHARDAGWGDMW